MAFKEGPSFRLCTTKGMAMEEAVTGELKAEERAVTMRTRRGQRTKAGKLRTLKKPADAVAPTGVSGGKKHADATAATAAGGHEEEAPKNRMPPGLVDYFLAWEKKPITRPNPESKDEFADFFDELSDELAKLQTELKEEQRVKGYVEVDDDYNEAEIDAIDEAAHRKAYLKVFGTLP